MNLFKPFTTPEYLFRPRQILVRFKRAFTRHVPEFDTVRLPWGDAFRIRPHEVIGANIWWYGVFDLVVAEAIVRLLDPSELGLDIGANIGQMTSLLRHQAGRAGRVVAFEPHPEVFAELSHNASLGKREKLAPVELVNLALSDIEGECFLDTGPSWQVNRGMSKLVPAATHPSAGMVNVKLTTLDQFFPDRPQIGVIKIDVEGHELKAFKGAAALFRGRCIRDIIFEDLGTYPTPVHEFLLAQGYSMFALHAGVFRPLIEAVSHQPEFQRGRGENYVATLDPQRVERRFKPMGWRALKG